MPTPTTDLKRGKRQKKADRNSNGIKSMGSSESGWKMGQGKSLVCMEKKRSPGRWRGVYQRWYDGVRHARPPRLTNGKGEDGTHGNIGIGIGFGIGIGIGIGTGFGTGFGFGFGFGFGLSIGIEWYGEQLPC